MDKRHYYYGSSLAQFILSKAKEILVRSVMLCSKAEMFLLLAPANYKVVKSIPLVYIHHVKKVSLYVMAALYFIAGINHFWHPLFYIAIMPPWLPYHQALVFISGICEILFALLLLPLPTRRLAAWCIILLLIAVFPANIQMMLNYLHENNPRLWIAILRLPVQIVLVMWTYSFTKN